MLLAVSYPPFEYIIVAVALLLGLIGKIVEFSKRIRQKSIEAEQQAETQFGAELEEAPEPRHAEPPPRLDLARRPPRPRHEEPLAPVAPLPPPRPARAPAPPPEPRREHEIIRILRAPHGPRNAVLLAEVLGRPKALRRGR